MSIFKNIVLKPTNLKVLQFIISKNSGKSISPLSSSSISLLIVSTSSSVGFNLQFQEEIYLHIFISPMNCKINCLLPQDPDEFPQLRRVNGAAPVHVKLCESVMIGGDLLFRMSVLKRRKLDHIKTFYRITFIFLATRTSVGATLAILWRNICSKLENPRSIFLFLYFAIQMNYSLRFVESRSAINCRLQTLNHDSDEVDICPELPASARQPAFWLVLIKLAFLNSPNAASLHYWRPIRK